jgi:hypothetical protein
MYFSNQRLTYLYDDSMNCCSGTEYASDPTATARFR